MPTDPVLGPDRRDDSLLRAGRAAPAVIGALAAVLTVVACVIG